MTILFFTAAWCEPCRTMAPMLCAAAGSITVEPIDVDAAPTEAKRYGVKGVPTLILVDRERDSVGFPLVGLRTEVVIRAWLRDPHGAVAL